MTVKTKATKAITTTIIANVAPDKSVKRKLSLEFKARVMQLKANGETTKGAVLQAGFEHGIADAQGIADSKYLFSQINTWKKSLEKAQVNANQVTVIRNDDGTYSMADGTLLIVKALVDAKKTAPAKKAAAKKVTKAA